jgi:hypothetical protein
LINSITLPICFGFGPQIDDLLKGPLVFGADVFHSFQNRMHRLRPFAAAFQGLVGHIHDRLGIIGDLGGGGRNSSMVEVI